MDEAQCELLRRHLALVVKWNRVYNLTAVRDEDKIVPYHVLDSLSILPYSGSGRLLDVGSGPGFPGVPLAIAQPDRSVTLLDSNHKKAAFLRQAKTELGLENVAVVCERVESYQPTVGFDVVVSRAFADLSAFATAVISLIRPGGRLLAMKGAFPNEELEQLPSHVCVEKVIKLEVAGLDARRHLIVLKSAAEATS